MNDGLISITITITKTITTTITITKTFFFFKKSLSASDVEAEPKFPDHFLRYILRSGGGLAWKTLNLTPPCVLIRKRVAVS